MPLWSLLSFLLAFGVDGAFFPTSHSSFKTLLLFLATETHLEVMTPSWIGVIWGHSIYILFFWERQEWQIKPASVYRRI